MTINIRREEQPGAVLQVPLPEQALDGRIVVQCTACRWAAWGQPLGERPADNGERARFVLQELSTVAARGLVHGRSVCILNRRN